MKIRRFISLLLFLVLVSGMMVGCQPTEPGESDAESEYEDQPLTDELFLKDDVYTTYCSRSKYDMTLSMQVDGTGAGPDTISTFPTKFDVKVLSGGMCANQDVWGEYTSGKYDEDTHEGEIFHTKDGQKYGYSLIEGTNYMLPNDNWNNYLLEHMRECVEVGITRLGLSEQGIWGGVGYEQSFRDQWKSYYGEEWQYFWDDPELYYKAQVLKAKLMLDQINDVFGGIKKEYPHVHTTQASHTSLAYFPFTNPIANHDTFASPYVDQMSGQTWSNTMELAFSYDGGSESRPFINGYVDYSYWANLGKQFPSKTVNFIIDAKGDGYTSNSLEYCKEMYQHQLASQLIFNSVYRYEYQWPSRAYSTTTKPYSTVDYCTIVNNITSLQGQMYKYQEESSTPNRAIKVGAVLLDSSNYQAGAPGATLTNNSYYGLLAGLIYNGLLVDSIPMGELADEKDILSDYDIVLVSYDLMKPQTTFANEQLKKYVENGGNLIYVGGAGEYEDLSFSWWKQAGYAAPQEHLLKELGITYSGRTEVQTATLRVDSASSLASLGNLSHKIDKASIMGYTSVEGAQVMYRAEDNTVVAFEKMVGKGQFYYFGWDPSYFCMNGTGEILWDIVTTISTQRKGITPEKYTSISYQRGPIYGFHALTEDCTTAEGVWMNPFEADLPIISSLQVAKEQSAVLIDVSEKMKSTRPVVLFAQGNNPTIIENKLITRVVTAGPQNSTGVIRLYIPEGYKISGLTATNTVAQKDVLLDRVWDADSRTLLITYKNNVSKVIVDVHYIIEE